MTKKISFLSVVLILLFLALFILEVFRGNIFSEDDLYMIATRYLGGVIALLVAFKYVQKRIITPAFSLRSLLVILPCFLVAINNFPLIPYFSGEARLTSDPSDVLRLFILCLGVGFFEEMLFRGCILASILKRCGRDKKSVFFAVIISSAIFGAVHIVNIFLGNVGGVLLQVGYTFLMGAMLSFVFIISGNVWYCVLLHTIYNFCGSVISTLGEGTIWDTPTVVLTVLVALLVTLYCAVVFIKTDCGKMFTLND